MIFRHCLVDPFLRDLLKSPWTIFGRSYKPTLDDACRSVSEVFNGVEFVREQRAQGKIGPHMLPVSATTFDLRLKADDEMAPRTVAMLYPPRVMLVHTRAMADLRDWASRENVPLADVIHALDGDRDLMVNWVHLTGQANVIVARELARVIREQLTLRTAVPG